MLPGLHACAGGDEPRPRGGRDLGAPANFLVAPGAVSILFVVNPPAGAPTAPAPPCPTGWRMLGNCAVFLAVCWGGCALLGRLSPFPDVPGIAPKWAWFARHRDEFDVLFIGSSRLYHQIIPAQFDAAVAAAGGPKIRSFNFGYDGMWPPESFYLLRRLLELRPARLKWVVIELMDKNMRDEDANAATMRLSYWHDTAHTRLAVANILASQQGWPARLGLLMEQGGYWCREMLNLGRGADLLQARLAPVRPRRKPYSWEPFAGYEAGTERPMDARERQKFAQALEALTALPPAPLRPFFRHAVRGVIADVREIGAEPIFVIAPTVNPAENFTELPDGAAVFAFNDPARYPALFDPAHHYDTWHLNPRGAVHFTALVADRLGEKMRAPR